MFDLPFSFTYCVFAVITRERIDATYREPDVFIGYRFTARAVVVDRQFLAAPDGPRRNESDRLTVESRSVSHVCRIIMVVHAAIAESDRTPTRNGRETFPVKYSPLKVRFQVLE